MTTYLFYDLETTGLNKALDQVIQFASIRTDMNFNEMERYSTYVKLRPDVVFAPRAMMTNRISIFETMEGLCEYEAVMEIHRLFNQPGTISVGYNSLKFDDEFMRFSFHRNLLPPYAHQYANGCSRMDILPMAICYYLYRNEILNWPEKDGAATMKLEYLNEVNRFVGGVAHNALVDVEATVELARRLAKEGEMWKYLTGYFNRQEDKRRCDALPAFFGNNEEPGGWGLMIGTKYGPERRYQAPVLSLGNSIPYSNQSLWLRLDLPELRETVPESIEETTWVVRKKSGADFILPPNERFLVNMTGERMAVIEENKQWLKDNKPLFRQIKEYYQRYEYPFVPHIDPDAALYQMDFPDSNDERQWRQFHSALMKDKAKCLDAFKKPEYRALAERILCRNAAEHCPPALLDAYKGRVIRTAWEGEEPVVDYKGEVQGNYTAVLAEIAEIRNENGLDAEQKQLLNELEQYIKSGLPG